MCRSYAAFAVGVTPLDMLTSQSAIVVSDANIDTRNTDNLFISFPIYVYIAIDPSITSFLQDNISKILVLMEFLIYSFFNSFICMNLLDLSRVLGCFRA